MSKPKKTDEEIKKALIKKRDELISEAGRMKKLTLTPGSGWVEYCDIVRSYIKNCKVRKATTALDLADDKTIYELRLLDHEIFILEWALSIPKRLMTNLEKMEAKEREE